MKLYTSPSTSSSITHVTGTIACTKATLKLHLALLLDILVLGIDLDNKSSIFMYHVTLVVPPQVTLWTVLLVMVDKLLLVLYLLTKLCVWIQVNPRITILMVGV